LIKNIRFNLIVNFRLVHFNCSLMINKMIKIQHYLNLNYSLITIPNYYDVNYLNYYHPNLINQFINWNCPLRNLINFKTFYLKFLLYNKF
jgi:hypothetical protein